MIRSAPLRRLALPLVLAVAAVGLGGCATSTLVQAGTYAAGSAYTAPLGRNWTDVTRMRPNLQRTVKLLTVDGPVLNQLYLAHDIPAGQGLFRPAARQQNQARQPVLAADATRLDLADFLAETVTALGYQGVEATQTRPATFGGRPGIEVEMSARTETGLNMSARALAAVQDGKLQLILFLAPQEHYFDAYRSDITAMFNALNPPAPAPVAPVAPAAAPPVPAAEPAPEAVPAAAATPSVAVAVEPPPAPMASPAPVPMPVPVPAQ